MATNNSLDAILQRYNGQIHQEPMSYIVHCIFWMFFWILATPIVLTALILQLTWNLWNYYLWNHYGISQNIIHPLTNPNVELAVVITGCDSGFGKDLAWEAARQGFTVFAGCINEASLQKYETEPKIVAVQMDVTSDADVQAVVERVKAWLQQLPSQPQQHDDVSEDAGNKESKLTTTTTTTATKKKRVLHALINNAGLAIAGLTDWLDMTAFEKQMQVNFFGTVRTCKAFLPIFKDQAPPHSPNYYGQARIINMISAAGMNAVGTPATVGYEASKNAAEAFTASLRWELNKFWKMHVTAINPTFHETPIAMGAVQDFGNTWNKLSPELRDEYGQDFFDHLQHFIAEKMLRFIWRPTIVIDEVMKCLISLHPPAQVLVGMDCRFVMSVMRMIPAWARTWVWMSFDPNYVMPSKMRK